MMVLQLGILTENTTKLRSCSAVDELDDVLEFDVEKKWWNKRVENEFAWKVSIDEIKKRGYNLDIKNPHQEADTLESPEVILEKFRTTEEKISSIQDEIINVLTEALK